MFWLTTRDQARPACGLEEHQGRIAHRLAEARVNIEYAYSATPPDQKKGLLVLRVSDVKKALKVLNS